MRLEAELAVFSRLGGTFVTPIATLAERMSTVRGFVSDWDGVFNQGTKGEGAESTYSEPDSMGTNLLRYALWRAHGQLPIAALITGADNPSARAFAQRVRVKGWGKSPPRAQQWERHGKPHREQDRIGATRAQAQPVSRSVARVGRERRPGNGRPR